jgi:hypothetical protein
MAIEHLRQNHTHANPKEALAHVLHVMKAPVPHLVATHHALTLVKNSAIRVHVQLATGLLALAATLRHVARVALLNGNDDYRNRTV